jgi:hypothetical protein
MAGGYLRRRVQVPDSSEDTLLCLEMDAELEGSDAEVSDPPVQL